MLAPPKRKSRVTPTIAKSLTPREIGVFLRASHVYYDQKAVSKWVRQLERIVLDKDHVRCTVSLGGRSTMHVTSDALEIHHPQKHAIWVVKVDRDMKKPPASLEGFARLALVMRDRERI